MKNIGNINKRIAAVEGTIQGLIEELAELKLAVDIPSKLSLPPPALPMDIFNANSCHPKTEIKEIFVLFDFETGGTFYGLFFALSIYISNCLLFVYIHTQDSEKHRK